MEDWANGLDEMAITITDENGNYIDMNNCSKIVNLKDINKTVVGRNIDSCHNAKSMEIIKRMMTEGVKNIYTITKNGREKLIYQSPWFKQDGSFGGLVEVTMFIPKQMPHYDRDAEKKAKQ